MEEHPDSDASSGPESRPPGMVTVVTWNLQGAQGLDIAGVVEVLAPVAADVVVLQEVQRAQARGLAQALDLDVRWAFKHLAWRTWPEGLAVLTPHRLAAADVLVLRRSWTFSWRRRIAVDAVIDRAVDPGSEGPRTRFGVIDVHLSPHDAGSHRRREVGRVLRRAGEHHELPLIVGDFNDVPGGAAPEIMTSAGWTDAWAAEVRSTLDGSTNWTPGDRSGRPPTQRLDYVFVPPGWIVDSAEVVGEAARLDWFAARSDHLPLIVRTHRESGSPGEAP